MIVNKIFATTWFLSLSLLTTVLSDTENLVYDYVVTTSSEPTKEDTTERFFSTYESDAQLYLDRPTFKGTPITGKMLAQCARNTYDSTGIVVPLELALSQAQWESGMGRYGKSATFNPYNVGEWDRGTMWTFKSTQDGIQAYFNLIANDYLSGKSVDDLLTNFVNIRGHRYASSELYESHIGGTYRTIRKWITTHSDTASS